MTYKPNQTKQVERRNLLQFQNKMAISPGFHQILLYYLSYISALKPDIGVAEKVSDSLACGEALEDAMLQRDMVKIEEVKKTIEKKGEHYSDTCVVGRVLER